MNKHTKMHTSGKISTIFDSEKETEMVEEDEHLYWSSPEEDPWIDLGGEG